MAEDLQGLLERIQQDGVEKAEARAAEIIAAAEQRAKAVIADAEAQAAESAKQAEADAKALVERGEKSLEQAGRDVVLSVAEAIQQTLERVVALDVYGAMSGERVSEMILQVVEAYASARSDDTRLAVLIPETAREKLSKEFLSTFAARIKGGAEIKGDQSVVSGFHVSVMDQDVQHEFSTDAITEAMCSLLRPKLAEILKPGQESDGQ